MNIHRKSVPAGGEGRWDEGRGRASGSLYLISVKKNGQRVMLRKCERKSEKKNKESLKGF